MDNFFYDLNKRMANLSQQQTLTEGAVAEASYSAKAARAGKDIGKPGKNFSKIAADAGKRYGSKAAGERVAGAVLNKLRHPKEDVEEGIVDFAKEKYHGFQTNRQLDKVSQAEKKGNTAAANAAHAAALKHRDLEQTARYNRTGSTMPKNSVQGYDQDAKNYQALKAKGLVKGMAEAEMEESALQGYLGKKKYGPEGMKALQKAGREHAGKDKMNKIRSHYDKMDEAEMEEGNDFTKARLDAIKANKPTFTVGGKTYKVTGDTSDEKMMEDFDDMIKDVKKRMGPRVGDVKRGARHDIETTATGIRATRRHDDEEDTQPTGEKRKAGRPKGADKGPERVTGKAYKHKGGRIKEEGIMPGSTDADAGEYGYEGDMAKDQIHTIVRHAKDLEKILSNREDLPEWVQSKLAKIEGMMAAVDDYMQTQHERGAEMDQGIDLEEESTDTRDNRAERAGKKVVKDIEYDEKKKDGIHGKKRGSEDDKAEKAGKRVTKDIEYDEKKKEKKVAETTTSGSVATGGDAPKSTKGGVQIGKGIYDSLNREVENMISESMSVNVSMTRDDNGSHKNITVTASDEDAEMLAQLLARAGLGGGMSHGHDHGHEEPCPECGSTDCGCDDVCPDCGQSPCACDNMMDEAYGDTTATENKPNWPTDTEYSDDAMQYSGGLNKPKASGMATIPVTDVQTDGEDKFGMIDRLREMAGITQQRLMPWERTMKEEAVEEGVVDTVKGAVKKGLEKLGHGSDEEMRKDLQKKMGVPATGQKPEPKDDKKMQESLMQEFANFKI